TVLVVGNLQAQLYIVIKLRRVPWIGNDVAIGGLTALMRELRFPSEYGLATGIVDIVAEVPGREADISAELTTPFRIAHHAIQTIRTCRIGDVGELLTLFQPAHDTANGEVALAEDAGRVVDVNVDARGRQLRIVERLLQEADPLCLVVRRAEEIDVTREATARLPDERAIDVRIGRTATEHCGAERIVQ